MSVDDMDTSVIELWREFAELTQDMLNSAAVDQWDEVAKLALRRQEVEQRIGGTAPVDFSNEQLAALIQTCLENNHKLTYLAKRTQGDCQSEMSKLTAGKKAASAYAP